MADVFAVLPGFTLDLYALTLPELMAWRQRAADRVPKES